VLEKPTINPVNNLGLLTFHGNFTVVYVYTHKTEIFYNNVTM